MQLVQVEHFLELLEAGDTELASTRAFASLSEPVFQAIWDNPEDAAYDAL